MVGKNIQKLQETPASLRATALPRAALARAGSTPPTGAVTTGPCNPLTPRAPNLSPKPSSHAWICWICGKVVGENRPGSVVVNPRHCLEHE